MLPMPPSSRPTRRPSPLRHVFLLAALFALVCAPMAMAADGSSASQADAAPLDLAQELMGNGNGNGNGNSCQNVVYTYVRPADPTCAACQTACAAEGGTAFEGIFDRVGCICGCCLD